MLSPGSPGLRQGGTEGLVRSSGLQAGDFGQGAPSPVRRLKNLLGGASVSTGSQGFQDTLGLERPRLEGWVVGLAALGGNCFMKRPWAPACSLPPPATKGLG